ASSPNRRDTADDACRIPRGKAGRIPVYLPDLTAGDTHVPSRGFHRHRRRARGVAALGAWPVAQPAPCDAAAGDAGGQPRRWLRRGPGAGLVRAGAGAVAGMAAVRGYRAARRPTTFSTFSA